MGQSRQVISIDQATCPRCNGSHVGLLYRPFAHGDLNFTHWSTCPDTGEPLLMSIGITKKRNSEGKFRMDFLPAPGKSKGRYDPRYPNGKSMCGDIEKCCTVDLPPVGRPGVYRVKCNACEASTTVIMGGSKSDFVDATLECNNKHETKTQGD